MKPQELHHQRILLSPLNWGMGHVSRCIGLIDQLLKQENFVVIACSDEQRVIFEQYFSDLQFAQHDGYPFRFGKKGRFSWDLLKRFQLLKARLRRELRETKRLCKEHKIDVVIADHRYGFRADGVHSICITHQLNLPVLWYELPVQGMHRRLLRKFDELWIMDFADSRLAGRLSHNEDLHNVEYIGPYSRFQLYSEKKEKTYDYVLVASGPAVYAQQLINEFTLEELSERTVVLAPGHLDIPEGVEVVSGDWRAQDEVLRKAKCIVSRSGYSTLMDVHHLKTRAEFTPTPGQREQEYLADLHASKKTFE